MVNLEEKFSLISIREQKLVFYAVPFLVCFVFIIGFIEPTLTVGMKTRTDIRHLESKLLNATASLNLVQDGLKLDPDIDTRNQIAAYSNRNNQLQMQFAQELKQLVPPHAMPLVLEQLFAKANKLKLVKMQSIAPRSVFDAKGSEGQDNESLTDGPTLYQHGLRITFEGSFFETRSFLVSAEKLDWKLHWQEIFFQVNEYPKTQVNIELFTLSTSEVYINVN
jgi:MSHA biogenesis protein MshJ